MSYNSILFKGYPNSSPCYQCKDRTLTCDSTCLKFQKYKEELKKIKKEIAIAKLNRKDHIR